MYKIFKRICDVSLSAILLVILSPLLIPIIIGLKISGEGYIFYKQDRIGFKNKKFAILKFATMLKNSPNMDGGVLTTKKDPRITPMGGVLRKSKINELPQLINILFGDMSFVGPRPLMEVSFKTYTPTIQSIIYDVKPGLTGVGSIVFRDEENLITEVKNKGENTWDFYANKIYPFKGELEIWYQKNQSLIVDIKILIITAWVIFSTNSSMVNTVLKTLPKREF
ncbi:MAG: sugar transferase [Flavobacteriaceae bacterium]|nr:sugar transferase [Flavobacteriaceae bacterium]